MRAVGLVAWVGVVVLLAAGAAAQQVTVGTPFHSLNDGFYENIGVNWGVRFRGGPTFSFGAPNQGLAPFGGGQPGTGANLGFGWLGSGSNGFFNFTAGQGYRQTFASQTPVVTLTNGVPGWVSDSSLSPFVMGYVPVVGGNPYFNPYFAPPVSMPPASPSGVGSDAVRAALAAARAGQGLAADNAASAPRRAAPPPTARAAPPRPAAERSQDLLAAAQESSAGRAAPSVAQARRIRQAEQQASRDEALLDFQRGQNAEQEGSLGAARVYYQMAARKAEGPLRQQIQERLDAIKTAPR